MDLINLLSESSIYLQVPYIDLWDLSHFELLTLIREKEKAELIEDRKRVYYSLLPQLKEGTTIQDLYLLPWEQDEKIERLKNLETNIEKDKEFLKKIKNAQKNKKNKK